MGRGSACAPLAATVSTLAALLAAGAAVPAEARLPTKLIVVCSPKIRCTDRTKQLHRVQVGVKYRLQLPISEPTSVSSGVLVILSLFTWRKQAVILAENTSQAGVGLDDSFL